MVRRRPAATADERDSGLEKPRDAGRHRLRCLRVDQRAGRDRRETGVRADGDRQCAVRAELPCDPGHRVAVTAVGADDVPGVVVGVVTRDGLAWAKGYGTTDLAGGVPLTPATRFRIGSVSKVFTATAILQLRDAGKLRLDDPVVKHLPWFKVPNPFPNAPPITVEHLLTHTSGLSREAPFDAWTTHEFPTRAELRVAMPRVTVISPPGKTYRYSNLGVALLGEIVATVSGESWAGYVRAHITAPLGMTSTTGAPTAAEIAALPRQHRRKQADGSRGTLDYYDAGAIAPAAAIVSTLEDLARFAALQLTADPAGPPAGLGRHRRVVSWFHVIPSRACRPHGQRRGGSRVRLHR